MVIVNNIVLIGLFMMSFLDSSHTSFCEWTINLQYLLHSGSVPVFIILFFRSISTMKPWTVSLIGLYLLSFDVFSDLLVTYYFIEEDEPIFAVLQITFVITGQIVGAISDVFGEHNGTTTTTDKVMTFCGFG